MLKILEKILNKNHGVVEALPRATGHFKVTERETGKIVINKENLVVDTSGLILSRLLGAATSTRQITYLEVGTGTTPPSTTDTTLGTSVFAKLKTTETYPDTKSVKFTFTLTTSEANGYLLTEFGLFDNATTMFSRVVTSGYAKDATTTLDIEWTITFN